MAQASFSELEHDLKKRRTRRELFLEKMDKLVPWERLERRIEPFYPKAGRGRRPYPLGVMLRVHCVQLFYNLSDPGMEDLLYEVESVRRFVGLRLTEALPDETTPHPELPASAGEARSGRGVCSRRSMRIWRRAAIGCARGRSLTRASSRRRRRRRTGAGHGTPRCIRRRRASSGISG